MKVLYVQPFSGASGDMFLGALVDAGLSIDRLREGLSALRLPGWQLEATREHRGPFLATRVRVLIGDAAHSSQERGGHHGHRHLRHILEIIEGSALPEPVVIRASAVFRRLAEAEAHVHGIEVEKVHFHEVGAVDSIVDIVGTCLGLHLLAVDEVRSAAPTVGTGFVQGAHGRIPLPAPATLELLRGFPVEQRDTGAELTTPTGAALLTTLAAGFGTAPPLTINAIGYGAGDRREDAVPNVLRVVLGETQKQTSSSVTLEGAAADRVAVLECNVDDMTPQWIGHLLERLLEAGALDVTVTPILMKKSRPAHAITVLVSEDLESSVLRLLLEESTTLGVRRDCSDRIVLERETRKVSTPWGDVAVKLGRLGGRVVTATPEYEDLKSAARQAGRPLKDLHETVMRLFREEP